MGSAIPVRLAGLLVVAATIFCSGCAFESVKDKRIGNKFMAIAMAREFVRDRLRSPSSAEFGDEIAEVVDGATWRVTGYVDAQNGFGAMIRAIYQCNVKKENADYWKVSGLCEIVDR